jgi:hypothetical protein
MQAFPIWWDYPFKREIQQNISMANIPILYKFFKQKKLGVAETSFPVSAVSMTPLKPILATFEAVISANTIPYAKRV